MSERQIESYLRVVFEHVPLIRADRGVRAVEWMFVGFLGMFVDLGVTYSLLGSTHYLLANGIGFLCAVSFNFSGNWILTYDRPDGHKLKQYASYVILHSGTFAVRAAVIFALVSGMGMPATVATAIGVGVASILNFIGNESIFGGIPEVWLSLTDAANHVAHVVYSSRMRSILLTIGLYQPLFDLYAWCLDRVYRHDSRTVTINGVSATFLTEYPTETVSVFHTVEEESDILRRFVEDIEPTDHVVDVGANVGVYTCLSGQIADSVTAVEPHIPTAQRCRRNMQRNRVLGDVQTVALGASDGQIQLSCTNDAVGTQRPEKASEGDYTVPQKRGDSLPTPDVLKIDVEGAECETLKGYIHTLASGDCRIVYLECHSEANAVYANGVLEMHGYSVEQLSNGAEIHLRATR